MSLPKVNIVILNFKHWQDSRDCLESVLESSYTNYSVFLVDNHSENNSIAQLTTWLDLRIKHHSPLTRNSIDYIVITKQELKQYQDPGRFPKIFFVQNDQNAGFAAGINIVLRNLENVEGYIWLLNPDITIQKNTLDALVHCAGQSPFRSIIGATVRSFSNSQRILYCGGGRVSFISGTVKMAASIKEAGQLDYISGGCLFTHTANIKELGLFPEEYFLYWEETDWCYRAKQKGFHLSVCQEAICYDKISTAIGKSYMADYYYVRNGLIFIAKFQRNKIPFVLFFNGLRFFKRVFSGSWARAGGVIRGTFDFIKMKPHEVQ